jgi:hypothetical protein
VRLETFPIQQLRLSSLRVIMLEENPTLIQPGPPGPTSRAPLVLIHDGSGLISSYFWLGSLSRKVFGIFNPHFEGGGKWDDGVPEIAREYALMIKSVIPKGKILLGGNIVPC